MKLSEKNGIGYARCYACSKGGTVFDLAAEVLNLDARKNFKQIAEHIADTVGYSLSLEDRSYTKRKTRTSGVPSALSIAMKQSHQESPIEYLPYDMECRAWESVRRAMRQEETMKTHSRILGLPLPALLHHCDEFEPEAGLLGVDEKGALLYLYTAHDGIKWRVTAVKRRSLPMEAMREGTPRFTAWKGSKKQSLWGASLIDSSLRRVIITEGESDALAVRYSLHTWLEMLRIDSPEECPCADDIPLVLAKPDAGTFKQSWADALKGLDVILLVDADEAGKKGAASTIDTLKQAGAARVMTWQPLGDAKDPRACFTPDSPLALIEDILINKSLHYDITKK